uniref:Uncharacterized protein n=1 Tax=Pelusios castaneus TaxID=367368 RepID=A0A8C8R5K2_9SAUR
PGTSDLPIFIYENRIKTFTDWPFMENCKCTPENMARAGFIHCPSANEPDVAKCFFCLIELEGWEPNDDPQIEHSKRPSNCGFLSLTKNFDDLTMEEYYMLEMDRLRTFLVSAGMNNKSQLQRETAELKLICKFDSVVLGLNRDYGFFSHYNK